MGKAERADLSNRRQRIYKYDVKPDGRHDAEIDWKYFAKATATAQNKDTSFSLKDG